MCDVMNKRFGIKGKECYLENDSSTLYYFISSDFILLRLFLCRIGLCLSEILIEIFLFPFQLTHFLFTIFIGGSQLAFLLHEVYRKRLREAT